MFCCIVAHHLPAELSLSDFAYTFSPVVEELNAATVVIDTEGCDLLFGSAYQMAGEIVQRAKSSRLEGGVESVVNVALAANPDVAIHAATRLNGITYVSEGEELTCLGDFPIETINYALINLEKKLADDILETLSLWGIRTFREFAALPGNGVSERLGQNGLQLQHLAAGKTQRHLKCRTQSPVFTSSLELDHPLAELEPLSFIFARLLNQLCAALNAYALATNELSVQLQLQDRTLHERKLSLPHPLRDHKLFLKLLLLDTEMHPPQAAVTSVSITCEPVKPRVLQSGLFVPLAPAPDKLELTLARLAKLVGAENVGSPVLVNTHRPDTFTLKKFALVAKAESRRRKNISNLKSQISNQEQAQNNRRYIGFRTFRPPLRAVVHAEKGCPTQISAWNKQRSVYGKVVNLAGPWRTTGDWWRNDRWARDEWDVALEKEVEKEVEKEKRQTLYRIYRELDSGNWFVEGNYD
jgi:protein ImuB